MFARWIGRGTYSLRGQGTLITFDENGYLNRVPAEEVMGFFVERARQKLTGGNVVSIEPKLRERRFKNEHQWRTSRSMLHLTSALAPELVGEVLRNGRELARITDMAMLIVTHEISFRILGTLRAASDPITPSSLPQ